jgi:RIO kinase 1
MYHQCKLVHADLSEYNILYHNSHLYIIDVSQSVEHDHPSAFDFLRNDLKNVEEFFGRFGVRCLRLRRCFEFVTKEKLSESEEEDGVVLKQWLETQPEQDVDDISADTADSSYQTGTSSAHEDSVFMRSYIPRTLNEVYDPERDVGTLKESGAKSLIYADTIGLVDPSKESKPMGKAHPVDENEEDVESEGDEDEVSGEGDEDESTNGEKKDGERTPRGHRHEDREAKKACSLTLNLETILIV